MSIVQFFCDIATSAIGFFIAAFVYEAFCIIREKD